MPGIPNFAVAKIQRMELATGRGYVVEVPMYHLDRWQYLAAARNVAAYLGWQVVEVNTDTIRCYAPGIGDITGEVITITVTGKKAILEVVPEQDHGWDGSQGQQTADRYNRLMARVIDEQDKRNRNLHPMHREKYGALIPSRSYQVTPFIIYINALVFVAMVLVGISPLQPTTKSLFLWGGNFRPAVIHGEWWRLLSYMFLHGGIMHLLMNTYAMLYIGMFLEPLMGRFRFASAYVLTGICAGLMSIVMHPFSVGVGASGAIFGLYGVFLSMLTTSHIERTMRKTMLRSIMFFVVLNLLYGLQGNTDNAAHIGGLLSGLAVGYVYYPGIASHASPKKQLVTTMLIASFVLALAVSVVSFWR